MAKYKIKDYPATINKAVYRVSNFLNGLSLEYDDGVLAPSFACMTYNWDFTGGSLKTSLGFSEGLLEFFSENVRNDIENQLESIGSIIKIFVYRNYDNENDKRSDKLLLLSHDLSLFIIDIKGENTTLSRVRNITFTSVPNAISYRLNGHDVLIFTSPTDNMVVYDGENYPYEVLDAPKVSSMDLHFERLFVTTMGEKAQVLFSNDLDPTNWSINLDEAGFIEMVDERGALNRVISFNDYLYVFRDYGISRITAFGDQEGFSVSHLFVSSAKIFPNSVCVCGDRILFLASNGLYSFDGYTATKILSELENLFEQNNLAAHGAYFKGKYYLCLNLKFDESDYFNEEGFACNCLLEFEPKTGKYKIVRGVDIIHIQPVIVAFKEEIYFCARRNKTENYKVVTLNNLGKFLDKPLFKSWKTGFYNAGKNNKRKCLRSISLDCSSGVSIRVVSNTGEKATINPSHGAGTYNLMLFGSKFSFEFYCDSDIGYVLSPELTLVIGGDS